MQQEENPIFPQTFHLRTDERVAFEGMSIMGACFCSSLVTAWHILQWLGKTQASAPPSWLLNLAAASFAIVIAVIIAFERSRITLHADRIDIVRFLAPKRRVMRSDITGRSTGRIPNYPYGAFFYVVITQRGKRIGMPPFLNVGKDFEEWMRGFPTVPR